MSISGLHSCKPGNEPVLGVVKTFVVEQRPATDTKKAWTKIKSAPVDQGGQPYRIMSAKPTGFTDSHGNVSFNLELDAAPTAQVNQQRNGNMTKDDYWQRKDDRDEERAQREIANKPRIERQHSQEMAIRYFAQRPEILKATESAEQAAELIREMTSWFQRDISRSPEKQAEPGRYPADPAIQSEPEPEMPSEPGEEPY